MKSQCSNCRHAHHIKGIRYECRFNAPLPQIVGLVRNIEDNGYALAAWPEVEDSDWCSQYLWDNRKQ
jgi:hypothetical protein